MRPGFYSTVNGLNVCAELTKLIYGNINFKENPTEEKVIKTYFFFYKALKELVPPPLEKVNYSRLNRYLIGGALLTFTITLAYIFYLFKK